MRRAHLKVSYNFTDKMREKTGGSSELSQLDLALSSSVGRFCDLRFEYLPKKHADAVRDYLGLCCVGSLTILSRLLCALSNDCM
jgi:hypothetical protein